MVALLWHQFAFTSLTALPAGGHPDIILLIILNIYYYNNLYPASVGFEYQCPWQRHWQCKYQFNIVNVNDINRGWDIAWASIVDNKRCRHSIHRRLGEQTKCEIIIFVIYTYMHPCCLALWWNKCLAWSQTGHHVPRPTKNTSWKMLVPLTLRKLHKTLSILTCDNFYCPWQVNRLLVLSMSLIWTRSIPRTVTLLLPRSRGSQYNSEWFEIPVLSSIT